MTPCRIFGPGEWRRPKNEINAKTIDVVLVGDDKDSRNSGILVRFDMKKIKEIANSNK